MSRPYKNIVNIPHYSNKKVMITGGGSGSRRTNGVTLFKMVRK